MPIDPANATELATIAREVGAEVLKGNLRYPFKTGNWHLGDVDLSRSPFTQDRAHVCLLILV